MISTQRAVAELARLDHLADLVVEDLGGGARDRVEAGVLQPGQVVGERHPALLLAVVDLLGREGVDVDLREGSLQRREDLVIVGVILVGMDAALDAELGGAARHRVATLRDEHFHRVVVGVGVVLVSREAAVRAAHVTDVGEVHVPADDVGDEVALVLAPRDVGGLHQREQVGARRAEQQRRVVDRQLATRERALEHVADRLADPAVEFLETHAASSRSLCERRVAKPVASASARQRSRIDGSK